MRSWLAAAVALLIPYSIMVYTLQEDLAEAYCGILAIAGLVATLFNFRRREQVRRATSDLSLLAELFPTAVSEHDRTVLRERAEDGVVAGLILSSYSAILVAFIRPLAHLLECVLE